MKSKGYWLLVVLTVVCGLIGGALSNWAFTAKKAEAGEPVAENWADRPAEITTREYFQLYFKSLFHTHESEGHIYSYTMANFYPGSYQARALVNITQAWNDGLLGMNPTEKRRALRENGADRVATFEVFCKLSEISNRWFGVFLKPSSFIIVRHVREKDYKETLAVTMDGTTYFDEEHFKEAEARVLVEYG